LAINRQQLSIRDCRKLYERVGSCANPGRPIASSRLSTVVAIIPVIKYSDVAEDKPDQIGEACLGANIVRQNHDALLE
jgi:hypothetical protein